MYDQLHLNSCSTNALACALRFDEIKQGRRFLPEPSRLFIYFNERVVAGVVKEDAPVSLRDGYRTITKFGTCPEHMWPYHVDRFRRRPTPPCYRAGRRHEGIEEFPFVFGLAVHKSMLSREVKRTGVIPVPRRGDPMVGGHAVVAVGYDRARRVFIIRNSWGHEWGHLGYAFLPYEFTRSSALSWDFWTMRRVS